MRDAVLDVASDPEIRERVRAMREHCHRAGGSALAADRILGLASAVPAQRVS